MYAPAKMWVSAQKLLCPFKQENASGECASVSPCYARQIRNLTTEGEKEQAHCGAEIAGRPALESWVGVPASQQQCAQEADTQRRESTDNNRGVVVESHSSSESHPAFAGTSRAERSVDFIGPGFFVHQITNRLWSVKRVSRRRGFGRASCESLGRLVRRLARFPVAGRHAIYRRPSSGHQVR